MLSPSAICNRTHLIALLVYAVSSLVRHFSISTYLRPVSIALICLSLGYVTGNLISRFSLEPDQYDKTRMAFLQLDQTGHDLRQFLEQELRPGEIIAATNGQAAGYVLQHPLSR